MSVEEIKAKVREPAVAIPLSFVLAIGTVLGVQVVFPNQRLESMEMRQAATVYRVDTLRAQFDAHVRAAAREDTLMMQRFRPLYVAECLDRSPRETDLMGLRCDTLVAQPRRSTK